MNFIFTLSFYLFVLFQACDNQQWEWDANELWDDPWGNHVCSHPRRYPNRLWEGLPDADAAVPPGQDPTSQPTPHTRRHRAITELARLKVKLKSRTETANCERWEQLSNQLRHHLVHFQNPPLNIKTLFQKAWRDNIDLEKCKTCVMYLRHYQER